MWVKLCQSWTNVGRSLSNLAYSWPSSTHTGQSLAKFGSLRANISQHIVWRVCFEWFWTMFGAYVQAPARRSVTFECYLNSFSPPQPPFPGVPIHPMLRAFQACSSVQQQPGAPSVYLSAALGEISADRPTPIDRCARLGSARAHSSVWSWRRGDCYSTDSRRFRRGGPPADGEALRGGPEWDGALSLRRHPHPLRLLQRDGAHRLVVRLKRDDGPNPGRISPTCGRAPRKLAQLRPKLGRMRPDIGQTWPGIDLVWDDFDQLWAERDRHRPKSALHRPNFGRDRPDSARFRTRLGRFRPNSAKLSSKSQKAIWYVQYRGVQHHRAWCT